MQRQGISAIDDSEPLLAVNYLSWGVAIAGVVAGAALLVADSVIHRPDDGLRVGVAPLPGGVFAATSVAF